ncbi:hypothetical protein GCM10023220_22380 [Streptomyces ziwulingensis]|uniref:Uncharacterized protein n=1 Tax=Streptomyces ziwulingensis TaxID=1045501 RepID=A0ABP9BHA9_9ACTN
MPVDHAAPPGILKIPDRVTPQGLLTCTRTGLAGLTPRSLILTANSPEPLGGDVSTEQQPTRPTQVPASESPEPEPHRDFARKGTLAAISGAASGTARAFWAHLLGDDS